MTRRRVVVTGLGAITPLGLTSSQTWNAALEGKSGVGKITQFDPKDCTVQIAAEVKGYDPTVPVGPFNPGHGREVTQAVSKRDLKKMGRFIHFAMGAAMEAYGDSGLDKMRDKFPAERFGANFGVGMGSLQDIESNYDNLLNKGYKRISPFFVPMVITNLAAGQISIALNTKGINVCPVSACASSAHAIGESYRSIQHGYSDVMITGGSEAVISPMGIGGFASMKALSTRNDEPTKASRPFSEGRDGFVMGEGGVALILEELEFAKSRGAKIYGEIVGYGTTSDAFHMTTPSPESEGGFRAMNLALDDNGTPASEVNYANAHGTSTPAGDAEEALAICKLFKNNKSFNVSSTKSMTGHLLGGAGAVEAMFSLLAIQNDKIPPTINLENLDPRLKDQGVDFTPHQAVEKEVNYAISNSFGFGGTNVSLLFRKYA